MTPAESIIHKLLCACAITVWPDGMLGVDGDVIELTPEEVAAVERICDESNRTMP